MSFTHSVDYFGFTVRGMTVEEVMQRIGGAFLPMEKGYRGYPIGYLAVGDSGGTAMLGTGAKRNPRETHVTLSGGFLAGWTYAQLQTLAKWVRSVGGKFTRLDQALDDREGIVTVAQVRRAIVKGRAVTRFRELTRMDKRGLERKGQKAGDTLNVGSRQSQTFLRIYDKALERRSKGVPVEGPWVRWEMELKDERAHAMGLALASLTEAEYRQLAVGVLRAAIDFRQTSWAADPMDRVRARPLRWWVRLTEGFSKAPLRIEKVARKIEEVKQWVMKSLAPMLCVICCAPKAGEEWLKKVIVAGADRWKAKHLALLEPPGPIKPYVLDAP